MNLILRDLKYFAYLTIINSIIKVNCTWNDWGAWGSCSISCGVAFDGFENRVRNKTVEERFGGYCEGYDSSIQSCPSSNITCPRSCEWNEWKDDWSECSVTCGIGEKKRERSIKFEAEIGGAPCSDGDGMETKQCKPQECPGIERGFC